MAFSSPVRVLGIALLVPCLAWAQDVELNTITAVNVRGGVVEIVGTKRPNFTTFTMTDPARLVIDISEATFNGVPEDLQVGNGTITAVRIASYGSDASAIARVLVGFEKEVETDIQADQSRIVVKVLGAGEAPAVAQAAPPAGTAGPAAVATQQAAVQEAAAQQAAVQQAAAEEERKRQESEAQARAEAEAQAQAQADARAKAEAEAQAQAAAAAERKRQEEAAQVQAQAQAQAAPEADAKAQGAAARAEAVRLHEEAQAKARAEAQALVEEQARLKAEARARAEEEKRAKAEARAQAKAEREAAAAQKREEARAAAEARREEARAAAEARREAAAQARAEREAAAAQRREEARAAAEAKREARLAHATSGAEARPAVASGDTALTGDTAATADGGANSDVTVSARRKSLALVGFRQEAGTSRVVVQTSEPVRYRVSEGGERTVVLELENTRIGSSNNRRPLETAFFDSAVARVVSRPGPGRTVHVEVMLKEAVPFEATQHGNVVTLAFPRPGR